MKQLNKRNSAVAKQQRDKMNRTWQSSKPNMSLQAEKYFPKHLQSVESVIKKRVQQDKEIGRRRKVYNQNLDKEPQIYAPSPPKERPLQHRRRNSASPLRQDHEAMNIQQNTQEMVESMLKSPLIEQFSEEDS